MKKKKRNLQNLHLQRKENQNDLEQKEKYQKREIKKQLQDHQLQLILGKMLQFKLLQILEIYGMIQIY
jgi:hypothetical protein